MFPPSSSTLCLPPVRTKAFCPSFLTRPLHPGFQAPAIAPPLLPQVRDLLPSHPPSTAHPPLTCTVAAVVSPVRVGGHALYASE